MSAIPKTKLTPEEYLKIERKAEFKSEYFRGEMFDSLLDGSIGYVRLERDYRAGAQGD